MSFLDVDQLIQGAVVDQLIHGAVVDPTTVPIWKNTLSSVVS